MPPGLLREKEAAYDVVQEAFIKLWEHRTSLDPEQPLRAYVYTIVRNTAFKYMEQSKREHRQRDHMERRQRLERPAGRGAAVVEETMAARELQAQIRAWIDELPPRRQEAFRLSRFDGLTHEEIARVMDLAPRTVTHNIMLSLQHLRDRLATYQAA